MTKEEIINAIAERAIEEPAETLLLMTGITVAIAENIIEMYDGDKSKSINISTNQRDVTIHPTKKATLQA